MEETLLVDLPERVIKEWEQAMYIPDQIARDYLLECYKLAARSSKDPSSQNAAVILDPVTLVGRVCGVNQFPGRIKMTPERLADRAIKYPYMDHAESCVIHKCARDGIRTHKSIMVCPWAACTECAKSIIAAGVRTLVTHQIENGDHQQWDADIAMAEEMFAEHGVARQVVVGKLDATNSVCVLRRGQLLYP